MSGPVRFILVFVLLIGFGAVAPQTTSTQNSTQVAAPPVDTHTSSADVPTTTTISNATSSSNVTPVSAVTSNNKGTLDITTSPSGATVTVDGVSEGASPIEGLSVDAGTHSITVYLSGYDSQQEKIEIANSETKKLFYTLIPEADKNTVSNSTDSTLTSTSTSKTSTSETLGSETSDYQDVKWAATGSADSTIVTNDINDLTTAASNYDLTSLSTYADALYKDSQKAIDDSDLYSVSPDLQSAKDEYRVAMIQANWAAVFTSKGVTELGNGNTADGNADLKEATKYMKLFGDHATEATKLLNAYNSKKN